ncbi:hypothetical protein A1Z17_RS03390 [Acinetobacter baumannii]|nr:hypothetical protein [Acinetobacter baumannii]
MNREQVLEIVFLSFIKENIFINQDFNSIWGTFVEKRKRSNSEVNFNHAYYYFKKTLEAEYFFTDKSVSPYRYTSIFTLKNSESSSYLNDVYKQIFKKVEALRIDLNRNKIELNFLDTYQNEFPIIYYKIDHLIFKKQQLEIEIQSKINVLTELLNELNLYKSTS